MATVIPCGEVGRQKALFDGASVIHFKGFACGLDFDSETVVSVVQSTISILSEADIVVWDGDAPRIGSFAHVLTHLDGDSPKLVAFKFKDGVSGLLKSFDGPLLSKITVCEVDPTPYGKKAWTQLGIHALNVTRADRVLSFGGGEIVLNEFDSMQGLRPVVFHLVDVPRLRNGKIQHSALHAKAAAYPELIRVVDLTGKDHP
eukprot:m.196890 g.196890  ORF g.196890 m.196890 type:complete len:202 (+) comp15261_c0_seq2:61-666(+)